MERAVKIYAARGMTGRVADQVVAQAKADRRWWMLAGFEVLCPVTKEGLKASPETIKAAKSDMLIFWPMDKQMIRDADVLVNFTPHLLSHGVNHETGLNRYGYWKPVVHIFPLGRLPGESSIVFLEDDVIVDSEEEAMEAIYRLWGTRYKRLKWRLKMLNRSLPKWIGYQIKFLYDTVR